MWLSDILTFGIPDEWLSQKHLVHTKLAMYVFITSYVLQDLLLDKIHYSVQKEDFTSWCMYLISTRHFIFYIY